MTSKYKLHPFFHEIVAIEKVCEHVGCSNKGEFKAPRSRVNLRDYLWFCLEHVRIYNENWNYYQGMDPQEAESEKRFDETWQRPTWPFTQAAHASKADALRDSQHLFHALGEDYNSQQKERAKLSHDSKESRALIQMDMDYPYTQKELKIRYVKLAKKYHPDTNGGSREAENRLKDINLAYEILKNFLNNRTL